jgi:hypothetical protein
LLFASNSRKGNMCILKFWRNHMSCIEINTSIKKKLQILQIMWDVFHLIINYQLWSTDTSRIKCICIRHDTYDYTELCHFLKNLLMSPCQCPCHVRVGVYTSQLQQQIHFPCCLIVTCKLVPLLGKYIYMRE